MLEDIGAGMPSNNGTGAPEPDDAVAVTPETNTDNTKPTKKPDDTAPEKLPWPDDLWHTEDGTAWATVGGINWKIGSKDFRGWLTHELYKRDKKAPGRPMLDKLVPTYEARARFDGIEYETNLRTARTGDDYWLDLGDKRGRAICINATGWQVIPCAPAGVRFWRAENMRALPDPIRDEADIWLLRDLVNIADDDALRLVLTWLSYALLPNMKYPVLEVGGPPGTAKTMGTEFLRATIDPASPLLRGAPKGTDLIAAAKNNWIVAFDNLSGISAAMADDICRLSTGGGFGGRKYYTEDEEKVFDATRPVIINGIGDLAVRGDLADRSIEVRLKPLDEYRPGEDMKAGFEYAHPRILAGLLDAVAIGLSRLEDVKRGHPKLPRMADFALWGRAVAPALGWNEEDFALAHRQAIKAASAAALENNPVAPFLITFLEGRPGKHWSGRPEQLWQELRGRLSYVPAGFPNGPMAMGWELKRLAPQLPMAGVRIEIPKGNNHRKPYVISME